MKYLNKDNNWLSSNEHLREIYIYVSFLYVFLFSITLIFTLNKLNNVSQICVCCRLTQLDRTSQPFAHTFLQKDRRKSWKSTIERKLNRQSKTTRKIRYTFTNYNWQIDIYQYPRKLGSSHLLLFLRRQISSLQTFLSPPVFIAEHGTTWYGRKQ